MTTTKADIPFGDADIQFSEGPAAEARFAESQLDGELGDAAALDKQIDELTAPKPGDEDEHQKQPDEIATELVDSVVSALVNVRIYANTHPRVTNSLAKLRRLVGELAKATAVDPVAISCVDNLLIHQKRPLLSASLSSSRLVDLLHVWSSGGIEFDAAVSDDDLACLLKLITSKPKPGETAAEICNQLVERDCRTARLLPPYTDSVEGAAQGAGAGSQLGIAVRSFQAIVDLLQDVTISVCNGGRIQFDPVRTMADQVLSRLEADDGPLLSLARQDQYDAFTFGHSVRVAVLAMTFARSLTQDRDLIVRIGTAALLHDVGKALIPFEILHVQRQLTDEEFVEMSKHPQLGAELLLDHHDSDPLAIASAFGHHRVGESKGYPTTAHKHRVTMVTEIVKICDVYEALTAARPYKQPMSPVRAYRVMLSMGGKFDRAMLHRFIRANGVFPVGQPIELNSGEFAVVRRQTNDMVRPIIELVTDAEGGHLDEADCSILDLSDLECCAARKILGEAANDVAEHARQPVWLG